MTPGGPDGGAEVTDTIAAIATAAGAAGIGVIRLSGPRAIAIVAAMLQVAPETLDRRVRVRWAHDRGAARVDEVLAFAMRAPHSFTGEDVAELHGHGGTRNLARLLEVIVEHGARVADPGEFTRRAVANGKLDLIRAEALLDVIHAGSERAWRLAQRNLDGQLGGEVARVEHAALELLAEIEGRIDFPDDDLGALGELGEAIERLSASCARLADGFRQGRAVSHGVAIALVGPVNVGKSSLLNALVGRERALVAAAPGTTRDYLEVHDVWHGVAVTLIDTAGTRETADAIEQHGIALGEARVAAADVVAVINDGQTAWDTGERFGVRAVIVRSKADLGGDAPAGSVITCATTGQGLDGLRQRCLEVAGVADREGSEEPLITTERQHALVVEARDALAAAGTGWRAQQPSEIVALELRRATQTLARLRGLEVGDRVLDELFARFCIGK